MRLTLAFEPAPRVPINMRGLTPQLALTTTAKELLRWTVRIGNAPVPLGDVCRLTQDPAAPDELVLAGETANLHYAGWGMRGGRLRAAGGIGRWAGAEMEDGELVISGNAGDGLGAGMRGGRIHCDQDAGDYVGAALPGCKQGMSGGTMTIGGSVGREAGAGMRRGLLVIAGHSGELAGAEMLAGSIFILGRAGANPGLNMRRGSIVADSLDGEPPVGFLYSGFGDTVWLRVFLRSIANLGFSLPPGWWQDRWCRYSGDHLGLGKGELYIHDPVE